MLFCVEFSDAKRGDSKQFACKTKMQAKKMMPFLTAMDIG
jgi:hypothetical protein